MIDAIINLDHTNQIIVFMSLLINHSSRKMTTHFVGQFNLAPVKKCDFRDASRAEAIVNNHNEEHCQ